MPIRVQIEVRCCQCGSRFQIDADTESLQRFEAGASVHEVLPYLSAAERSLLANNTCQPCLDDMLEGPEEER